MPGGPAADRVCFSDSGAQMGEYAWYSANSGGTTHPVGEKKPNAWGLYDMHGNVCELVRDAKPNPDQPPIPAVGPVRVGRGGCWWLERWGCDIRFDDWGGSPSECVGLRARAGSEQVAYVSRR